MIFCCGALPFLRCGLRVGRWAVDAEVRIGQLFKALPKAEAGRPSKISNTGVTNKSTKQATVENLGFNKMQASRFETLAEHPEIVAFSGYAFFCVLKILIRAKRIQQ